MGIETITVDVAHFECERMGHVGLHNNNEVVIDLFSADAIEIGSDIRGIHNVVGEWVGENEFIVYEVL